jgi:hypothetical protein
MSTLRARGRAAAACRRCGTRRWGGTNSFLRRHFWSLKGPTETTSASTLRSGRNRIFRDALCALSRHALRRRIRGERLRRCVTRELGATPEAELVVVLIFFPALRTTNHPEPPSLLPHFNERNRATPSVKMCPTKNNNENTTTESEPPKYRGLPRWGQELQS